MKNVVMGSGTPRCANRSFRDLHSLNTVVKKGGDFLNDAGQLNGDRDTGLLRSISEIPHLDKLTERERLI